MKPPFLASSKKQTIDNQPWLFFVAISKKPACHTQKLQQDNAHIQMTEGETKTMIHRTENGKSCDKANVFILGDVSDDTVRKLENLLEKDGYDAAIVAKDRAAKLAATDSEAVFLVSENGNHHQKTKSDASQSAKRQPLSKTTLRGDYTGIIGKSPQFVEILSQVDKVANTVAKVLICGETGTGKELIARALHENSDRSANRMVSVNCAAIPAPLLESELFGHEKGAFTNARTRHIGKFERANNGDPVSSMKLAICHYRYRQSCCERLSPVRLNVSGEQIRFLWISELSRQHTVTSHKPLPTVLFDRISITV